MHALAEIGFVGFEDGVKGVAIEGLGGGDACTLYGALPSIEEGVIDYIVEYKGAIPEEGEGFVQRIDVLRRPGF